MENFTKTETPEIDKMKIKENSDIAYWAKEYDISAEDLKNEKHHKGIYDKIIESYLEKVN